MTFLYRCLACGSVVLTLPSDVKRELDRPCQRCRKATCLEQLTEVEAGQMATAYEPSGYLFTICPVCLFAGDNDDFDCLGADEGNLFCPACCTEFDPSNSPSVAVQGEMIS